MVHYLHAEFPTVYELLDIDVALYAVHSARRHYTAFYETVWQNLNERRNKLIPTLTQEEAANYEVLETGGGDACGNRPTPFVGTGGR